MKIKYIFIIGLLLGSFTLTAKGFEDDIVFQAMKKELDRSIIELKKDSLAKPFFIKLLVQETNFNYGFFTSFGKVSREFTDNVPTREAYPMILVGDYHRTQPINRKYSFYLPSDDNESAIRSMIWLNLDRAYKEAAVSYVDQMTWLKQENETDEEKARDNYEKREATSYLQKEQQVDRNFTIPKKLSLKTGKYLYELVKKENLKVENSSTAFWFSNQVNRYYDTEGSKYKYYIQNGHFNISLDGVNESGEDVRAYRSFSMNELRKFPSENELRKAVEEVVSEYKTKLKAVKLEEPYMGPVLIVKDKVQNVVTEMLRNFYTSPKTRFSNGNHYQNMAGVRVISKQLSMRMDYGDYGENLNGVKIDLNPIDDEAVIPPDSIILIKNGILKNMLTTRQPVKNYPKSNGNNGTEGVLTVTGNEQYDFEEIKKMLIDEAKLQGLSYTYIINSDGHYHTKIDVETGEETPFMASINLGQTMKSMRRIMGVDKKMTSSSDGTIRYPASILIEDVEITIHKSNQRLKKDFVSPPIL